MHPAALIGLAVLIVVIALYAIVTVRTARTNDEGGWSVVRCRQGHLFETVWVPGGSFKAVRLGPLRYQRCPVGQHWAWIRRVDPSTLTPGELADARAARDTWVP